MMAKRTNRVAWGLAVVLVVTVLGGIGVLFDHYQSGLPAQVDGIVVDARPVTLLPRNEWGFGSTVDTVRFSSLGAIRTIVPGKRFRLGCFSVRVGDAHSRWPHGFDPQRHGAIKRE